MPEAATLEDFEEVVRRIAAEAIRELGRESGAITSDAAAKGGLSNNRLIFLYADALEKTWDRAADETIAELRRWVAKAKVQRTPLRDVAEQELRRLIPALINASRVQHAAAQFANQAMLESATERVDALEPDLIHRLRQFDINMDTERPETDFPLRRKVTKWIGEHLMQILIGLVILAIGAKLGL